MDFLKEMEGKRVHDPFGKNTTKNLRRVCVPGPVIVGAGPSGLAAAACLSDRGVPSVIIERSNCIASLWQLKSYTRLRLHLPKEFCELPLMPFPAEFPTYPSKQQFVDYLEAYTKKFDLKPHFNESVDCAEYDHSLGLWRVKTKGLHNEEMEYVTRWLIVATGENAEEIVPVIEGMDEFEGPIVHTSVYKSGNVFRGKRVLVVGCGNSGMEVCLDLCNSDASPSLVVRNKAHILPREMLGVSTFGLSMWLLKWLHVRYVDQLLLFLSWFFLGDTSRLGLDRPKIGPIELKMATGKTPVLDVGTLAEIRSGSIKVCPGIKQISTHKVHFVNGRAEDFDAIILATGYKSNVPSWLKDTNLFSEKDGLPKKQFPNGWKGEYGLYSVGFTKRGLLGTSMDAKKIAQDIELLWKADSKHYLSTLFYSPSSSPPPPPSLGH
ncbi:hypothetical protein MKW98_010524 [Papaver atlanticum]|uniref:Flavin-containing monooxygenase n=1 Tax=Papaver atlanticum TaxID=357466 RepID=A0AAD4S2G3_9MAGN|nr:hypothetical protein MKW98_010524 [Papaver atlanticum]